MIDATWTAVLLGFISGIPLGILCTFWINRLSKGIFTGASIGFTASIFTTFVFSLPVGPYYFYIFSYYGISALIMWTVLFLTLRDRLGLFTSLGFIVMYPLSWFALWKIGILVSLDALPWQELATYLSIFSFIIGCLLRAIMPNIANSK
jgi:ABC-type proline/glycine betaine transport system permease subunit